ncbi:MAG TPA: S26 family signal peptidase, partial [Egibacteraceae bacterium]|nr:S26 family signal peptidase [Egibacteraceae bacterium]
MSSRKTRSGRRAAVIASAAAIVVGASVVRMFGRFAVAGDSMRPALEPGDRLIVGPLGRLSRDAIVIVSDPRRPERQMAKRIVALSGETVVIEGIEITAGPGEVAVIGDNLAASTDSRTFGAIPTGLVTARAWYRYAPEHRAGWLEPPRRYGPPREPVRLTAAPH